ncbi:tRNA pseudouridine synthase A [Marivirga lumbricoides]|uniref:tRNA pseudouridine synthase A n=1 Tax=Marivirga lumbricoides TaxID=1046115 RepID=A0ABQ1LWG2_9BACT|nr:tRNA pseudouridine synthase A [Marivirga lumbricoides]
MSRRFHHFYLVEIQYLGYRLHGWQFQHGLKTVQGFLELTVKFVLGEEQPFKIMGSGRTDAMVSASSSYFELFLENGIDENTFFADLNQNLPSDLKVLSWQAVDENFNILQNVSSKEYRYYFGYGEKQHPFSAPFMACIPENLDIILMQQGAKLYEGTHDFVHFCHKPKPEKDTVREIKISEIFDNKEFTASFFPKNSFVFRVVGKGFMRYQIRMMMGALFLLGKHEITLSDLENSLINKELTFEKHSAPASGLMVYQVNYDFN